MKNFRTSLSYNQWLRTIDRSRCKVSGLTREMVDIEVHHYDNTLWDICSHCLYKFLDNDIVDFNDFYLLMLLSELHMNGCVSYIPLAHDYHHMIHENLLEFEKLFPDYKEKVTEGNYVLRDIIIQKYIDIYKKIENV